MLSKRYESTEVDHRTWLHVPSRTPWSTSSDTHMLFLGSGTDLGDSSYVKKKFEFLLHFLSTDATFN